MFLSLPYPPTVNSYLGRNGSRSFLTAKVREFRREVWLAFTQSLRHKTLTGPVSIAVTLIPGKGSIPDIDNGLKALLDALQHAKVFLNDRQVEELTVHRLAKDPKHPRCIVRLEERRINA